MRSLAACVCEKGGNAWTLTKNPLYVLQGVGNFLLKFLRLIVVITHGRLRPGGLGEMGGVCDDANEAGKFVTRVKITCLWAEGAERGRRRESDLIRGRGGEGRGGGGGRGERQERQGE